MSKIYISGGISNMENDNIEAFIEAEMELAKLGFEVVNPLKLDHSNAKCYEDYLRTDIKHLMDCDCIYMLTGWRDSNGARIEYDLAKTLKYPAIFETGKEL